MRRKSVRFPCRYGELNEGMRHTPVSRAGTSSFTPNPGGSTSVVGLLIKRGHCGIYRRVFPACKISSMLI